MKAKNIAILTQRSACHIFHANFFPLQKPYTLYLTPVHKLYRNFNDLIDYNIAFAIKWLKEKTLP